MNSPKVGGAPPPSQLLHCNKAVEQQRRREREGGYIENAGARPPHPEMASPANGWPAFFLGVYACFLAKYSCILQAHWPHTSLIMRSIFNRFFNELRSIFEDFGTFLAFGGPSGSIFSKAFKKLRPGGRAPLSKYRFFAILGSRPEPQNP